MILDKKGLFRRGRRVFHAAPEVALARRFSKLCGQDYYACDFDPGRVSSLYGPVRRIDLCSDLVKLPSGCFDLIIHNHVLEHLPCDVESTLLEMERILAPGGRHLISVPIRGETTIEDIGPDLAPEVRLEKFGQADHVRLFGRASLIEMLDRVWGRSERHAIEPSALFGDEELTRAAIPPSAWNGWTGDTIFYHEKPAYRRAARQTLEVAIPPRPQTAFEARGASETSAGRLFLHIGMPRSGGADLQNWLSSHRSAALDAGLDYWGAAENHSELMFTAFASEQKRQRGGMWFQRKPAPAATPISRQSSRAQLDAFLSGLADRAGAISAEALWTLDRAEVDEMAEYLRARLDGVTALCWVRSPADYFALGAQERIVSLLPPVERLAAPERSAPLKYGRLDAWLAAFGADNLVVRAYRPDLLTDLAETLKRYRVDLPLAEARATERNKPISLSAAKTLLALTGPGGGDTPAARAPKYSPRLLKLLRELKGDPFVLPESLAPVMAPIFAEEAAYLAERFSIVFDVDDTPYVDEARLTTLSEAEMSELISRINDFLVARHL